MASRPTRGALWMRATSSVPMKTTDSKLHHRSVGRQGAHPRARSLRSHSSHGTAGAFGTQQDELFTWLDTQPFQVVCLQETWYRSHMDFSTRGWQCINSGIGEHAQRAHAGVMILLRSSAFNMQSLRFNHVIPGHVLHVKVFGKGLGWIEIMNVYQHAWGHQTAQSTIEAKRAAVWNKLRATLGQVPRGSTLVLCGDLNYHHPETSPVHRIGHAAQVTALAGRRLLRGAPVRL